MAMYYKNNVSKRRPRKYVLCANVYFSGKRDAFWDGMGSVLDIFPDPRARAVRAYATHYEPRAHSVNDAIWGDWAAIAQDMWTAIDEHAPERSEEAPAGPKTLTAR